MISCSSRQQAAGLKVTKTYITVLPFQCILGNREATYVIAIVVSDFSTIFSVVFHILAHWKRIYYYTYIVIWGVVS